MFHEKSMDKQTSSYQFNLEVSQKRGCPSYRPMLFSDVPLGILGTPPFFARQICRKNPFLMDSQLMKSAAVSEETATLWLAIENGDL